MLRFYEFPSPHPWRPAIERWRIGFRPSRSVVDRGACELTLPPAQSCLCKLSNLHHNRGVHRKDFVVVSFRTRKHQWRDAQSSTIRFLINPAPLRSLKLLGLYAMSGDVHHTSREANGSVCVPGQYPGRHDVHCATGSDNPEPARLCVPRHEHVQECIWIVALRLVRSPTLTHSPHLERTSSITMANLEEIT